MNRADFAESVRQGLSMRPRTMDPQWLYDATGSELYEQITATEEYYPTRTEEWILAEHAASIRALTGECAVVELGSGSSRKTQRVLDVWQAEGAVHYVPVDVSASALEQAASGLRHRYPEATIAPFVGSWSEGLASVSHLSPKVVLFLGSTIGNLDPGATRDFLRVMATSMGPQDTFLLGVDRVKPPEVLLAAYDDAAGWTRRFILNLFARMNRELECCIPLEVLSYRPRWNEQKRQMEMWVHFARDTAIHLGPASHTVPAGDEILVEISRKFEPDALAAVASEVGLVEVARYGDPKNWFAELLFRRRY